MALKHCLSIVMVALFVHALGTPGWSQSLVKVPVQIPSISPAIAPFAIARDRGYYRDEGLDVQLVLIPSALGMQALLAGNIKFSTAGGSGLLPIMRGAPVKFVFTTFHRPMFWLYAKPEIADVKALRGRRIGVTGLGSGPDNLLREKLKQNGIDGGRESTILALGLPGTLAAALRNGVVDAGMVSPPFNFVVRDGGFRELVSFLKEEFVELQGSIVAHERVFQNDPVLIEKFVRGTIKGLRYARDNKAGTIAILLRYIKIKDDLASQYYYLVRPIMTADATVSVEMQRRYVEQAVKVLNPKEPPAAERLYNYAIARKINAELDGAGWKPGK